jgi:hypothetical protein
MDLLARHSAWIARCVGRGELTPLNPDDVAELAALLGERAYRAGAVLFRVGELPARMHIVHVGAVELSRQVGGRRVVLQVLRAGDVFGDVPLLVRMTEPFDARASTTAWCCRPTRWRCSDWSSIAPGWPSVGWCLSPRAWPPPRPASSIYSPAGSTPRWRPC